MSYADRVHRAATPQLAMRALADGVDELLTILKAQPAQTDPWGEWTAPEAAPADTGSVENDLRELEIAQVQEALRKETDPETIQALNAKLNLLKDTGAVPDNILPGEVIGADEHGVVHVPVVSAERQATRRAWAIQHELGPQFLGMDLAEAADAFAKGGPVWLYYGNRPALMTMPPDWKRAMVHDLEEDSPIMAQSMGRDILKDLDPGTPGVTLESMGNELAANHG